MITQQQALQKPSSIPSKPQKILQNKANWRYLTLSDLTYITKKHPKMLSTVQLSCNEHDQSTSKGIKILCRALKNTKRISALIMNKDGWYEQNTKELESLVNFTNRWKNLSLCYNQSYDPTKYLLRLKRCKNLSNLDVSLACTDGSKIFLLNHLSQQFHPFPWQITGIT